MSAIKIALSKKQHFYILGIYRSPSTSVDASLNFLFDALEKIPLVNKRICIVGDFNVDSLVPSKDHDSLKNTLALFDISRLSLPPTRITSFSATSIDMVGTNFSNDMVEVEVINTGLSDHTGQYCVVKTPLNMNKSTIISKRLFKNDNIFSFRDILGMQSWDKVYQAAGAEEAYTNFAGRLSIALDIACPVKTFKSKPRKNTQNIYCTETNRLRREYITAQDKFLLTSNEANKVEVATKKKAYDLKLRDRRREVNEQLLAESNNKAKAVWNIINTERVSKKKDSEPKWQIEKNGELVEDLSEIANHFNSFFNNIADETLRQNNIAQNNPSVIDTNFQGVPMSDWRLASEEEVYKTIASLQSKTSSGFDEISSKLLKSCIKEIYQPLTDVINKSLSQGIFPSKLKVSKIFPLHKKGNRKEVQNFRPISLISTISKIIEKVVLKRVFEHLLLNNLLQKGQHGFISGRSTITALTDLIEYIIENLDKGNTTVEIFLDLSKAFDCLDHSLIVEKLKSLGFDGLALAWFCSYLEKREQIVEIQQNINGSMCTKRSAPLSVKRGVPQGSVLGPVLFVLFTSDFIKHLEAYCYPVMYADDTVLVTSKYSVEELEISTYISIGMAEQYCASNDLVFNATKTKYITMGKKKDELSELPNLTKVEEVKHLGMTIDNNLSWNSHVDQVCAKLSSAIFALKRIKLISTAAATKTAYHAIFESHFRYGIILWGGSSAQNLQRVLVLQKHAVRIMAGLNFPDTCRDAFRALNILTVTSIYIIDTIVYASKQSLPTLREIHSYNTRNADNFHLPIHRTTLFTKKPSFAGANLLNMLPHHLKNCNPNTLKRKLQDWLLDNTVYTLEEFKTLCNS